MSRSLGFQVSDEELRKRILIIENVAKELEKKLTEKGD